VRVPLSWLRDFAPFEGDPADLARTFDELGMVVEGIEHIGEGLDDVVVAKVLEVERIPKADKIRLCRVDDGSGGPVEVVCGAWNFEAGATVAFARVGAVLPGGFAIGRRKMRGVESNGMICSAAEMRLGEESGGIMLLDESLPAGQPVAEALGVEADVVFDLAIEANRPDANSIIGVARDAAAKLGLPFTLPAPQVARTGTSTSELATIEVESSDLCPRFTATAITGVRVGAAPAWVQRRLNLAGMRSINNVVDASNYVMLELGQPTHPYDLERLGGRGLRVRRAKPGETLTTLDGTERRLGEGGDDCVICDATDVVVGVGGIMGGASSEIEDSTTTVLLEAANFDAMTIARTSKRLNLRTEASARFERGVDPEVIDLAVARFCELLGTGEVASDSLDDRSGVKARERITVRTSRLNELLGTELTDEQIAGYLAPIGFEATLAEPGVHEVLPPSFRPDATLEVDVIEEVARHHGYASIPRTFRTSPGVGLLTPHQAGRRLVRQVLLGAGVNEAYTPSLLGPGDHERTRLTAATIVASNAMIQEESVLRTSLLPGLLRTLAFNAARRNAGVDFFEIGDVFTVPADPSTADLPDQREVLGVALAGGAERAKHVYDILVTALRLADVRLAPTTAEGLHPTRTAAVVIGGETVGAVGEVDPEVSAAWSVEGRVGWIELDLRGVLAAPRLPDEERPVSRFPSSDIDLAFVAPDSVPASAVADTLRAAGGDLLTELHLFDVYRGGQLEPGTRSLAYRLRFNALDRTLTDEDVAVVRRQLVEAVEAAHGATLRG
jgi:phenylalanyl-tRNA synthetase beta chain